MPGATSPKKKEKMSAKGQKLTLEGAMELVCFVPHKQKEVHHTPGTGL